MLWVETSTRVRPGAPPSPISPPTASVTPSVKAETKPGWSKNWRTLSLVTVPISAVASSTRAKSSRYCRQLEYELYALVAIARSVVSPAAAASCTASSRNGAQLRLPQYTGRSIPRAASSASIAALSARFWALIGLTPPKCR
jgi:hypothetical protein